MEKTTPQGKKRGSGIFRFIRVTRMSLLLVLLPVLCLPAKAESFLQEYRVNLNLNKVTIKSVIEEIKKQTNLSFVYNETDVQGISQLDIKVKDETVEEVLNQVLKDKQLRYEIVDNVIIIRRDNRPPRKCCSARRQEDR